MKEKIKIGFTDFWGYDQYLFNPNDNYFVDLFSLKYDVVVSNDNPDLLIYSVFGEQFKNYDCKKILFNGENREMLEHYSRADVALSHHNRKAHEIYMPLWVIFVNWFNKDQLRPLPSNPTYLLSLDKIQNNRERFLNTDRKFCAFINNNPVQDRIDLFNDLQAYDKVDSYGSLFNNVGYQLRGSEKDKVDLLHNYKFTIAYENSIHHGYVTEKIIQPMEAGCIPIYKGGFFNPYFDMDAVITFPNDIFENRKNYKDLVMIPPLRLDNIMNDFSPEIMLEKILKKL